jgi:hypothetical protein
MELEQLKSIWQEETQLQDAPRAAGEETVRTALARKGRSYLLRIRRNILLEWVLLLVVLVIAGWLLRPYRDFLYAWERSALPVLGSVGTLFYALKLVALGQLFPLRSSLKAQIERQVRWLGRYLGFYRLSVVVLVPLLGLLGVFYGFFRAGQYHGQDWLDLLGDHWVWILGIGLAYAALAAWFAQAYIRRLYGHHYARLRSVLAEMEDLAKGKQAP